MTRGLYKSSPHRVRNTSGKTRYAFPYFYDPGWKAEIKELDIKVDPKELEILNKNRNYERWDQVKL
jgi:isopenicillin N synthase-like dioxygenase